MENNKDFLKYEETHGVFWKVFKNNSNVSIGSNIAILYDQQIKKVVYHGTVIEVNNRINKLIENQKNAELEIGFFLNDYAYYVFSCGKINIDVLNRIINEKGYFPDELKL